MKMRLALKIIDHPERYSPGKVLYAHRIYDRAFNRRHKGIIAVLKSIRISKWAEHDAKQGKLAKALDMLVSTDESNW